MVLTHIVPLRTYYLIFLTLIVCTAITVAVAFVDLGPMNVVVAMTIAVLKATLVVLFFMHVKYSTQAHMGCGAREHILAGNSDCDDVGRLPDARVENVRVIRQGTACQGVPRLHWLRPCWAMSEA